MKKLVFIIVFVSSFGYAQDDLLNEIDSDGDAVSSISIGISSEFLRGKDPQRVYENCVFQKTGQGPIRPLRL